MRGRKPLQEDQIQGVCVKCNKNKQMPGPKSKYGFRKYISTCSSCTKKKYNLYKNRPIDIKKPHCERCGFFGIDPCQLDIHHKDRNHLNNEISNLETLCSNCHRLEHKNEYKTWGLLGG